jgi:hydroxymethylglutaryl-CoA lyase
MADDELVGNMNSELMIPYLEENGLPLELDEDALRESLQIAGEIFV